jgi:hypothetical protein
MTRTEDPPMPIPLPNLDDRTYAELTEQARALLPRLDPGWTDHNVSDPGITLVELLAWLTEMLLFQVNEVPPANTEAFLALLNGAGWARPEGVTLDQAVRQTLLGLRERTRAATAEDYEWLALHAWPRTEAAAQLGGAARLRRVRCVPRRNLAAADPAVRAAAAAGHLSLVVLPEPVAGAGSQPDGLDEALRAALWEFLDARRTLTARHHVVGPGYVPVEVAADLALREDAPPTAALAAARAALAAFFDPFAGGPDQTGWPFGRAVHASEVYTTLDAVALVDFVENLRLSTPAGAERVHAGADGAVARIELDAHELARLQAASLLAFDVNGRPHQ